MIPGPAGFTSGAPAIRYSLISQFIGIDGVVVYWFNLHNNICYIAIVLAVRDHIGNGVLPAIGLFTGTWRVRNT